MLNINGLVRITKFEDLSDKAVKACVYFGTKKKDGKNKEYEWENSFFNAVVVGKAMEKLGEIDEKTTIFITSGLVKNPSYKDKEGKPRSYLSLTIFDFEYDEEKIDKIIEKLKARQGKTNSNKKENPKNKKYNSKKKELDDYPIDDRDIPF